QLPISYARSFDEIDEERRLAYVGITRAARTLALSWSPGFGRSPRQPSRFLQEIGTRILDERPARARSVGRNPAGGSRPGPSAHRRS
ncbi:MAG: ATP-dependent DNA helicase, partial [Microbacterium sp.]|uniref:3'-5' exonuclease n=1 Tax=Microbacterium sp. TaxID=51671 RepID=UPI00261258FB